MPPPGGRGTVLRPSCKVGRGDRASGCLDCHTVPAEVQEARRTGVGQDRAVGTSYSFLVGPLIACGALLVIILMCRWVFAPPKRRPRPVTPPVDHGLLVPVASVRTRDDAEMLRGVLREAGIRSTLAGSDVLVFPADAPRARDLVSS